MLQVRVFGASVLPGTSRKITNPPALRATTSDKRDVAGSRERRQSDTRKINIPRVKLSDANACADAMRRAY